MTKKINWTLVLLCALVFTMVLQGCKKGEDDPAFTLTSREKRMEGAWKLKEGVVKVEYAGNSSYSAQTYSFTNSKYTTVVGGKGTFEGIHTLAILFSEDGTFEVKETGDSIAFTSKGRWDFVQKGKEYKNKERVVIRLDRGTGSSLYFAFFNKSMTTFTYAIKELRKDRLVFEVIHDLVSVDDKGQILYSNANYVFER